MKTETIETQEQLVAHIREMVKNAEIEIKGGVERNDDEDLGGWVNGTATLEDGSTLNVGWYLYSDCPGMMDIDDEVRRYGWAILAYDKQDLLNGEIKPSERLVALFDWLKDEDDCVWSGESFCDSPAELLAGIAAQESMDDNEARDAWTKDLRNSIQAKCDNAATDPGDLLKMLRA